jgi:TolB protein
MTTSHDFDRDLTAWLEAVAPPRAPANLLADSLIRTAGTRQRRAWRIPGRWISMLTTLRFAAVPRIATYIALLIALILAMVLAFYVIGSQHRLPKPLGPAANGVIAFESAGQISLANLDGSARRALTRTSEVAASPVWSPDGTHLAFWSWPRPANIAPDSLTSVDFDSLATTSPASLVVTDADGGNRIVLGHDLFNEGGLGELSWAHDSRRIAYYDVLTSVPHIQVISLDGTRSLDVAGAQFGRFSPDDSQLAYTVKDAGVFLVNADGTGKRQLTKAYGAGFAFAAPQWSPDGRQIAFYAGADGSHDVWVASADGSGEHVIASQQADEYWPVWSPDGTKIAFNRVTVPDKNLIRVVVANPDGTDSVMLPSAPLSPASAAWSPDALSILSYAPPASGDLSIDQAIVVLDVSGARQPRTFPISSYTDNASWQRLAP